MKICIIGSSGFISESLINYCILQQYQITVWGRTNKVMHPSITFSHKDLLLDSIDFKCLLEFDIIFYCVANGVQSSAHFLAEDIFYINTFWPIKLIENLKALDYNGFLFTFGSYFEIGNESEEDKYYTEKHIVFAENPIPNTYCLSKRLLTRYVYDSSVSFTHYHCVLPTIYGIKEQPQRLIPHVINCVRNHLNISLTTGTQIRQYLWVEDLVVILFEMINKKLQSAIYNLPASQTLSVKEIAINICIAINYNINNISVGSEIRKDESMKSLKISSTLLESYVKIHEMTTIQQFVQANNGNNDKQY